MYIWHESGKDFLSKTEKVQTIKANMNKLEYIKIKYLHTINDTINKVKTEHRLGEIICNKILVSTIYNELLQINEGGKGTKAMCRDSEEKTSIVNK